MEKDDKFQMYANDFARNVPGEILKHLINLFLFEAAQNMGVECKDTMIDRVVYFVSTEFNYLPVNFIASSFVRGSLGKYGVGRLVPRTIHSWLTEAVIEYNLTSAHNRQEELAAIPFQAIDLRKYPLGRAICKKIDWLQSGVITSDEWDKISLKQVAEIIGAGHEPSLEYFGINNKNNIQP